MRPDNRKGAQSGVLIRCPCGVEFYCLPCRVGRKRCCSKACQYKFARRSSGLKYETKVVNPTWFQKGHQPAKPFPKGNMSGNLIKPGERRSPATEFKKGQVSHNFKGDAVGYGALHRWVWRKYGPPLKCEHCGGDKNMEWANRTWEYRRDRDDWLALCKRCHVQHDMAGGWGKASEKFPELRKR